MQTGSGNSYSDDNHSQSPLRELGAGLAEVGRRSVRRRIDLFPYLLVLPTLLLIALLVFPWITNIIYSLYDWKLNIPGAVRRFVGLANYIALLGDERVFYALRVTVGFVLVSVTLQVVLGMGIALLLNRNLIGGRLIHTLVLSPMLLTPVAVGLMWQFMWSALFGIVNYFLSIIGIRGPAWLADPNWVLPALIVTDVWQHTSYMVLMFLAALHSLPVEPLESARIDGANSWQVFWHVMLPLLRPVAAVAIMFRLMFSIRTFDVPFVLLGSEGGPGRSGLLLSLLLYRTAFVSFDAGLSSAISILLTALTFAAIYLTYRLLYREVMF